MIVDLKAGDFIVGAFILAILFGLIYQGLCTFDSLSHTQFHF